MLSEVNRIYVGAQKGAAYGTLSGVVAVSYFMMVGSTVDLFLRTAFNQPLLDYEETLGGSVSIRTVAASAIVMSAALGALIGVLNSNEE